MKKYCILAALVSLLLVFGVVPAKAKSEPTLVMLWPNATAPTLRLTFGKFRQMGAYAGQLSFVSDVTVENMSSKPIPRASFTVYLLDKAGVRIGDGVLHVSDLGPGQQARVAFQFGAVGIPATLSLSARNDASGVPTSLRTIPLRVVSVPPGATLKVDGQDAGVTPRLVNLTIGTHTLEFSKEGYATGSTPVEITQDELPGGSITFELGGLSRDTVELRDGAVLLGDVISMSMTSVVIRVDGKDQPYARNLVKKIILVERETVQQPAVIQPASQTPQ
ncbi:MAG: PEGA domain-containing protein [Acidobacteriia bacterium]|nr:PEGA domain-containing protein [Terriglobia bacterium]